MRYNYTRQKADDTQNLKPSFKFIWIYKHLNVHENDCKMHEVELVWATQTNSDYIS